MSQPTDYTIANATGANVRTDLNDVFGAILSSNSGTSEPSYKVNGTLWLDTTNNVLKYYQNSTWRTLFDFSSGVSLTGLNELQADDGAANDPAYTFTNYLTSGMYTGAGAVRFAVSGTEKFEIGASINSTPQATVHEVIPYSANNDAPYLIAGTTSYTGAATNPGTHGYQHRYKIDSGGVGRITIDTSISGVSTEVWALYNDGDMTIAKDLTADRVLAVAIGVESAPEFSFVGDEDTGFARASSDTLAFTCGGSHRAYINTTSMGPGSDNAMAFGDGSLRWSVVYSATGTINTSDATQKTDVKKLNAKEKRVAKACQKLIRRYRWIESVEGKGDDARYHFGVMAQEVVQAFEAEGLDPFKYGMVCRDKHEDGWRYGVRYTEMFAFIISVL